ncbi:hypothetical protein, conserved [Plasmodium gonderi]|uniref:Uncharacterized protein n=1 Tax=Plasmodium gonderi TaxID=77519 RepID=A0A1Y1JEQ7_PLAGO|nr:hypothetical protein, conserved [Plasmodium gonderi]GAW80138.1 hypothetical protein, conserved [Plasmodium gonderi]
MVDEEGNLQSEEIEGGTKRLLLKIRNEKQNEEILKKAINEYEQTIEVISNLTKKLNYRIIIPFSKVAFYEGEIKYTNNVYQDIGCNTYCERTAEKAQAFLEKKLKFYQDKYKIVNDAINKLTKELELSLELNYNLNYEKDEEEKASLNNVFVRPDGFLEIREEYHESEDEEYLAKIRKRNYLKNEPNEEAQAPKREYHDDDHHTTITNSCKQKQDRDNLTSNSVSTEVCKSISTNKNDKNKCLQNKEQSTCREKDNNSSKMKSLNVNEHGFLNIKENYTSSSDSECVQ